MHLPDSTLNYDKFIENYYPYSLNRNFASFFLSAAALSPASPCGRSPSFYLRLLIVCLSVGERGRAADLVSGAFQSVATYFGADIDDHESLQMRRLIKQSLDIEKESLIHCCNRMHAVVNFFPLSVEK